MDTFLRGRPIASCLALLLLLLFPLGGRADGDGGDSGEGDTPRRALERFLGNVASGRYSEAADDLELHASEQSDRTKLAKMLGAVIDRRLSADPEWLSRVSDAPSGDQKDGIAQDQDEVGRIPATPIAEPVRLRRVWMRDRSEYRWQFSHKTVQRVPSWYGRLDDVWLREHLPDKLLRKGPKGFVVWEWLALPVVLTASGFVAWLLTLLLELSLRPLARRSASRWDDLLFRRLRRPVRLLLAVVFWGLSMPYVLITGQAERIVHNFARVGFLLGLFFCVWRCVDVAVQIVRESDWLKSHPAAKGVIPLGYRLAEITVAAIAVVTTLQELGYPVTSLVAGLGIGGLAVALAAQKTVEHVFGGVMLSVDQPMRVGDLVRVDDVVGYVEQIGLRSTAIRTLERSLVNFPNGKLADMKIECLQARDNLRLHCTLGLTYDATVAQLDGLREALRSYITNHPKVWTGMPVRVHFVGFGESSLNLEVMAWWQESDWDRFLELRHEVLLKIMRIIEDHGAKIAFPTRTLHMVPPTGKP
ncbi:MAG TPA: mechanosensitive ion channel family protein [Pseudomonadota bacterium]|nr:mechanosensitive ion channel family protein [Pseudomonadota bacterium]HNI60360.1 mechanosensitive ion channel family protein [Pseudomonadota bacterium]HNN50566.1 mechanosensitive ion channel family protein [Pseudomonadota bacterium]